MVICVYARDSAMEFEEYEKFMQGLTKTMGLNVSKTLL